ncbi:hypothetical protein ABEL47_01575 [Escherichia coli]
MKLGFFQIASMNSLLNIFIRDNFIMTPKEIHFINLARKRKAAKKVMADSMTFEELLSKVLDLESQLKRANSELKYLDELGILRNKAVVECNIDYKVAYSSGKRILTEMISDKEDNHSSL